VKYFCTIFIYFIFFTGISFAQFSRKVDSLSAICNTASTDAEKVKAYGELAELYFVYQLDNAGDSVLQKQVRVAELSGDKSLILSALFGNAITNLTNWRSKETFDKALLFLEKGRDYAKATGSEEYLTLAHTRIAALYRKRGQLDNAFYNANIAFTSSQNIYSDSIKVIAAIELGDAYQAKGESLLAYKTYTSAFDRAADMGNTELQSEVYHRYAALYQSLKNIEQAKENLLRSLELNKENNNKEGLVKDYIDLARITGERFYIEKAITFATLYNFENHIIKAKGVMFGYYTYIIAKSDSTLQYINRNEDLKQVYINRGLPIYYWTLSSAYIYSNKLDSAVYYLLLAEPGIKNDFDAQTLQGVYEDLGSCYAQLKKNREAISYYLNALSLVDQTSNQVRVVSYSSELSSLYEKEGDYKNSIIYARKKELLKDSLQKLSTQRDIAMVEVNNEKKKHEKELEALAQKKRVKRNLQYMAITIAITLLFIFMIVLGMFPISRLTIKLLGYFAFISLFEFIVLLIDSWLHNLAHGEPLKIWLMKIVLIALLVPFQHYLEHGMIKFIESSKLHRVRQKLSIKKWGQGHKKSLADTIDDIEKDTAVL
jgi:tetratricopeptide (TPR) repeat protein